MRERRRFGGAWQERRLGEVAKMASGGTPLTSVGAYFDGEIPWVSINDMTSGVGRVITKTERTLSRLGLNNSAARLFPSGTVLYAMYASIGECSIAGRSLCTSQAILGIQPGSSLHTVFLYYWLTWIQRRVKTLGQQGTQANLNKDMVQDLPLPLPSLPEQSAIAAVLMDVDALIGSLEALTAKKRAIKRAAMQQLLTGRTRLPGFEGEWGMMRAGDIGRFGSGSGFPLRYQGQPQGQYPFFKVSDMNRDGNDVFLTKSGNYVTESSRQSLGAVAFPPKAIVFAKVGAAVFLDRKRILVQPSCLDNNMAAYVPDAERVDHLFVYYLLSSIRLSAFASTTALPSLSRTSLTGIPLPLPPVPEQRAIGTVLSDMDAEITALERRLDKTRALKRGMMQQLLTGTIRLPIPDAVTEDEPGR